MSNRFLLNLSNSMNPLEKNLITLLGSNELLKNEEKIIHEIKIQSYD